MHSIFHTICCTLDAIVIRVKFISSIVFNLLIYNNKYYKKLTSYKTVICSIITGIFFIYLYYIMSKIFQKPFSNDTRWRLSLLQLVIIHRYIVIVSEVVIHEFSQNWNEIYQCITSHTVENIYQCIGKFSVINDYYFLYLFALLWRKPCQCKVTHLLEKPYKCICLQDISYQYIVPSSLEKPYQSRNYEG